jgi:Tol biopolymer transport system component
VTRDGAPDSAVAAFAEALRGRYLLEGELGRGGMATVWLARDERHRRQVAVKLLRPDLSAVLGTDRFLREIGLMARLQHPHILPLLDSGEAQGVLYYVMQFVEGESLRQRLQREGQLPLDDALRLTREVAEALDYAHQQGIIHRDIKPENILLSRGHALVADFGIALAVTQAGGGRLTETGLSLGTPAYMSPEQAMAELRLDGRSDQYSLACVLYEMLAGEPPYTGPTAQAIIAKRLSEPVPHVSTLRDVPPALESAITRALARAPADRFPSAKAFADALLPARETVPIRASPRVRGRRLAVALAGGVLLTGGIVASVLWMSARRPADPTVPTQRQQTFSAQASDPALAPDGRSLVYVRDRRSLVLEQLGSDGSITLVQSEGWIAWPRWSPDGQWLYFSMLRDGAESAAIFRVPARGGTPAKVVDAMGPVDPSPDGRTLVRCTGGVFGYVLIFHDAVTGAERQRLPVRGPGSETGGFDNPGSSPRDVAWSPDGRWIASLSSSGEVLSTSTDGRRWLVVARDRDGPVRWSPTGDALYYLARARGGADIVRTGFDARRGAVTGKERTQLSGVPVRRTNEAAFDVSRSGHVLAYMNGPESQHLWAFRLEPGRDTALARRLSRDSRAYDWPAVNRDGSAVAVMQHDLDRWSDGNYFAVPSAGGEFTRLTDGPGYKSNPSWAPDGEHLAFVLTDSAGSRLVLTDRAGQRLSVGHTPPSPIGYFRTTWSADGRTILYPAGWGRAMVALDLGRGGETLTTGADTAGVWDGAVLAPDGREIVAAEFRRASDAYRLVRGRTGTDDWIRLPAPPGDNMPLVWRSDGWIYLFNDRDGDNRVGRATRSPSVWRIRPDGGRQERVAWIPAECRFGFVSMSRDARLVACAVLHQEPDVWLVSDFDAGR